MVQKLIWNFFQTKVINYNFLTTFWSIFLSEFWQTVLFISENIVPIRTKLWKILMDTICYEKK